MGFRRAFRRATRSIGRLGRSAGGFIGGLTGRGRSDDGAGEGYPVLFHVRASPGAFPRGGTCWVYSRG